MSADRRVRCEKTDKGNGKTVFSGSVPGPGRGGGALGAAGGTGAVVVQAVIFAALHGSWTARAYGLGIGLIFGWAARKAKSVWPGSALHIINNCLVFAARLAERGMG